MTTPAALFTTRLQQRLNKAFPGGLWTPANTQSLIGIMAETVLDAVANGEEIQFGRLGKFTHKVQDERIFVDNLRGGGKRKVPRRVRFLFEASGHSEDQMRKLERLISEFGK